MNPEIHSGAGRSLPRVRLIEGDHVVIVTPCKDDDPDQASFEPFEMPLVPRSLADWLVSLRECFWRQHRRCLAAVLLLDSRSHEWATAVPTQRCRRDSACWSTRKEDVEGLLPTHLLAGSFQCRILLPGEELIDSVPPLDGVHLVLQPGSQHHILQIFLRMGGIVQPASMGQVFVDDWESMLQRVQSRLTLV